MQENINFYQKLRVEIQAFLQVHPIQERKIWLHDHNGYLIEFFRSDSHEKIRTRKIVKAAKVALIAGLFIQQFFMVMRRILFICFNSFSMMPIIWI